MIRRLLFDRSRAGTIDDETNAILNSPRFVFPEGDLIQIELNYKFNSERTARPPLKLRLFSLQVASERKT